MPRSHSQEAYSWQFRISDVSVNLFDLLQPLEYFEQATWNQKWTFPKETTLDNIKLVIGEETRYFIKCINACYS